MTIIPRREGIAPFKLLPSQILPNASFAALRASPLHPRLNPAGRRTRPAAAHRSLQLSAQRGGPRVS
eukprot:scaffold3553_cov137-Isochrysis_galbana.AAC.5